MAFLLVISITGFTMHKHYCGDELTGITLYMDTADCDENTCTECKDVTVSLQFNIDMLSIEVLIKPDTSQAEADVIKLFTHELYHF